MDLLKDCSFLMTFNFHSLYFYTNLWALSIGRSTPVTLVLIQIHFKIMLIHYGVVEKRNVDDILEVDYLGVATHNNGSWLPLIILLHAITKTPFI